MVVVTEVLGETVGHCFIAVDQDDILGGCQSRGRDGGVHGSGGGRRNHSSDKSIVNSQLEMRDLLKCIAQMFNFLIFD